jgi:hypothetical protein
MDFKFNHLVLRASSSGVVIGRRHRAAPPAVNRGWHDERSARRIRAW